MQVQTGLNSRLRLLLSQRGVSIVVDLTEFLRRGSRYLRPDDVRDGDVVEVASEGRLRPASESRFGREGFELDVRLPDGTVKSWTVNRTTLGRLVEAWGPDTKAWVGRRMRLAVQLTRVGKDMRRVIYGYPVGGEEEAVKEVMADVRKLYRDRVDAETLEKILRRVRGLNISAEEAARLAGLKVVEEGGKKYVVF
jgi:hypothetical protein